MSHFVVEQKHRGVWKTIARRPTKASAQKAVREIRAMIREKRLDPKATPLRVRQVPD